MPSEASGIAGVYNFGQGMQGQENPVQQFAELMFRQKESQQRNDQALIQTLNDMASRGIVPDEGMMKAGEKAIQRLGGKDYLQAHHQARAQGVPPDLAHASASVQAPLPPGVVQAPPQQQYSNPWEALAQSVLGQKGAELKQTEAQTKASGAQADYYAEQTLATKEATAMAAMKRDLATKAAGGDTKAALSLAVIDNPSLPLIAASALPAAEQTPFFENVRRQTVGDMTPQQLDLKALDFGDRNADFFGGDRDKATRYFKAYIGGGVPAPGDLPTPTPKYIAENMDVLIRAGTLVARGLPAGYVAQFIGSGGKLDKLPPELKNFIDVDLMNAQANKVRAAADALQAETGMKLSDSQIAENISAVLYRMAEIDKLAATGDPNAIEAKSKIVQTLRDAAAIKDADPSLFKGVAQELAPYLNLLPQSVPGVLWGSTLVFNPMGGLPDHNHPDVQRGYSQQFQDMQPLQPGTTLQLGPPRATGMQDMFNQLLQRSMQSIKGNMRR